MPELNVTTSAISSLSPDMSWFSLTVIVGICAIVLSLLVMALTNVQRYKKLKGFFGWLVSTLRYFFLGSGTLLSLAVPISIIYYFGKQAAKGNTAPLWMTGVIIGGYFAISLIGWLSKKFIIDRVKKLEKESKKNA